MRFRERDVARIPARWLRTHSRASLLTGAPRAATSPLNSMRNYLFACLESEARLALLAHNCDPAMGVLHADQRNRDSLALDIMEPLRADVDAFLLDLLEDRVFTARDFIELANGVCRIAAPLTHELALTLPHWRECVRPIAANLAQTFRKALTYSSAAASFTTNIRTKRPSTPGTPKSPLAETPRRVRQPRPYATRKWTLRLWNLLQACQRRARCAASQCSSAGVGTANPVSRRRDGSTVCVRLKQRARRWRYRPPRETIRAKTLP
jgi:hypothetical protein